MFRVIILACTLGLASPAAAEQLADLVPQTAYGRQLLRELGRAPGEAADYAGLRAAYAADPGYTGQSRLAENVALGDTIPRQDPPAEADFLRLLFADFPLMQTQLAAAAHYLDAKDDGMARYHIHVYRGLLDAVLATRRDTPQGPVYKVLSVGEEYIVMRHLGREVTGQALLHIDGVPHDLLMSEQGDVLFDISAFFGR